MAGGGGPHSRRHVGNLQIPPRVSNQSEDDPGKLGKRKENTEPELMLRVFLVRSQAEGGVKGIQMFGVTGKIQDKLKTLTIKNSQI